MLKITVANNGVDLECKGTCLKIMSELCAAVEEVARSLILEGGFNEEAEREALVSALLSGLEYACKEALEPSDRWIDDYRRLPRYLVRLL